MQYFTNKIGYNYLLSQIKLALKYANGNVSQNAILRKTALNRKKFGKNAKF